MRKQNIKAVCSNDEARQYFKDKGLTYDDITGHDIFTLILLLNKHIEAAVKDNETSVDSMYLSKKVRIKEKENGGIEYGYLFVSSHYFTDRECISFNGDGFIGFAGWADQGNTNPILRAFLEWCDKLGNQKPEAAAEESEEKKTEEFYRGDLYYALGMLFPRLTQKVRIYRPLGNNAIHLLLDDGRELAFTYVHRRRWLIETYEHYKDRTGDDDQIKLAELDVKSWLMERFKRVD